MAGRRGRKDGSGIVVTKRTPISREGRPKLTEAAIAAYRRMKALEPLCTCPPKGDPNQYIPPCPACAECQELEWVLHREFRCRPWELPPLQSEPPEDGDLAGVWAKAAFMRYVALERAVARLAKSSEELEEL
jgi:hypothetical protein